MSQLWPQEDTLILNVGQEDMIKKKKKIVIL